MVAGIPGAHAASHAVLLLAQLAPIVGIWRLGWGPHDLFLLYLLEFLLVGLVTAMRIATNGVQRVGFDVDDHGRPLPLPQAPPPAESPPAESPPAESPPTESPPTDRPPAEPPPDAMEGDVMARPDRWHSRVEKPAAIVALLRLTARPLLFYLLLGGVFAFEGHGSFTSSRDGLWAWTFVALAFMAAHHGVSYVLHDLRRAERFALDLPWIVDRAYARTFAVTGLWSAAFLGTSFLDDPRVVLVCVIAAKALLEAGLHERERG